MTRLILDLIPLIIALLLLPIVFRLYMKFILILATVSAKDIDKLCDKYNVKRK